MEKQLQVWALLGSICLFDLILYVPSTNFQLYREGSSCVEPVLTRTNVSCSRTHRSDAGEAQYYWGGQLINEMLELITCE